MTANARGWLIALACGVLVYVACASLGRGWSWPMFLAVPTSMGFLLGWNTRTASWGLALGIPTLLCAFLVALEFLGIHGPGCLGFLGLVALGPVTLGALLGALLRPRRPLSSKARTTRNLCIAAVPLLLQFATDLVPRRPEVVVVTSAREIAAPPEAVWRNLHFYEEIRGEPPFVLRYGMPVPVRAEGSKARVGDTETCIYRRGHLKKRITERLEARRLAFEITEQSLHFEHDVRLLDGAFDLMPLPGGGTRLVLTTRYEPLCGPRWVWRPLETAVVRALHAHVAGAVEGRCRAEEGGVGGR